MALKRTPGIGAGYAKNPKKYLSTLKSIAHCIPTKNRAKAVRKAG